MINLRSFQKFSHFSPEPGAKSHFLQEKNVTNLREKKTNSDEVKKMSNVRVEGETFGLSAIFRNHSNYHAHVLC